MTSAWACLESFDVSEDALVYISDPWSVQADNLISSISGFGFQQPSHSRAPVFAKTSDAGFQEDVTWTHATLPINKPKLPKGGSKDHTAGGCSPCLYWSSGWCRYGLECGDCHFQHDGVKNKKKRLSKKARSRAKKSVADAELSTTHSSSTSVSEKMDLRPALDVAFEGGITCQPMRTCQPMSQAEANHLSSMVQMVFKDVPFVLCV